MSPYLKTDKIVVALWNKKIENLCYLRENESTVHQILAATVVLNIANESRNQLHAKL